MANGELVQVWHWKLYLLNRAACFLAFIKKVNITKGKVLIQKLADKHILSREHDKVMLLVICLLPWSTMQCKSQDLHGELCFGVVVHLCS